MSSRLYQKALNRHQSMILPPRVEDYISENNVVRAIDAYVDTLDLATLGFTHTRLGTMSGQPAYDPAALLKLYLYGYQQSVRSSRKLERETQRNLEVIWLLEGLRPVYKTIANFRRHNSKALKAANRDFILLCNELGLLGGEEIAVDGSFFKADTSKGQIHTQEKLNKQLEALKIKIDAYQEALEKQDRADDHEGKSSLIEDAQLADKLKRLKEKQTQKKALRQRLKDSGDKQISCIDNDARLLSKRGTTVAGYNAQTVVDDKNRLIVANDVTQEGNDTQQLVPMLNQAQAILQSDDLTILADSGYYEGNQLKGCEDQGIKAYVAIPNKSRKIAKAGRFTRDQFKYQAEQDYYLCPQGHPLVASGKQYKKNNKWLARYRSKACVCMNCPLREKCLTEKARAKQINRWQHEAVIERHKERMAQQTGKMKKRGALVEHPFGTLKHRAGMHHFLMRGLERCRGEFSLMVLGYNFTRVLNLLGVEAFQEYCEQRHMNV